jgi:ArsR family metal-binding transcriptional regulator
MIKRIIANIPFFIAVPFKFLATVNHKITTKLIEYGALLHVKYQTPFGKQIIHDIQRMQAAKEQLEELRDLTNKMAQKKKSQSNPTLHNIINGDKKNDPTFH